LCGVYFQGKSGKEENDYELNSPTLMGLISFFKREREREREREKENASKVVYCLQSQVADIPLFPWRDRRKNMTRMQVARVICVL